LITGAKTFRLVVLKKMIIINLSWAIFEVAADTSKISLRYSALCGAESDVVDAVRSQNPEGFKIL
jgi:hypothetical protein